MAEMRKKLGLLALVALITLVTATPALAALDGEGQPFSLVGIISAIDIDNEGNGTITVQPVNYRFAGQVLMVQVTDSTSYFERTAVGPEPIAFEEVTVLDSTNMKGTMVGDDYVASQVTLDVRLYRTQ